MKTIQPSERIAIAQDEYNIEMEREMRKELVEMCNLSQGIREDAQKEGMEQGLEQGIKQGLEQGRAMERTICKLISSGFDRNMILSLSYTEEEYKEAENAMASLI